MHFFFKHLPNLSLLGNLCTRWAAAWHCERLGTILGTLKAGFQVLKARGKGVGHPALYVTLSLLAAQIVWFARSWLFD